MRWVVGLGLSLAAWITVLSATSCLAEPSVIDRTILRPAEWQRIDASIERAIEYLLRQQTNDGSFPTDPRGQPGMTGLAVMACLSAGRSPSEGPAADALHRAIDYCLDSQREDGALCRFPQPAKVQRYNAGHTVYYNHGITGLMLGEAYGMSVDRQNERISEALPRAIQFLRRSQLRKPLAADRGGWRYAYPHEGSDADMSCTAWQLMLLRSAKNAGFDVPDQMLKESVAYVERCYDPRAKHFRYAVTGGATYTSGGAVGGAIVSLAMAGKHNTQMARDGVQWLLKRPVERYACSMGPGNNYHYGVYYGSQATYQIGGDAWADFYPRLVAALLGAQQADGSWPPEAGIASPYGRVYSTSLAILSLTPPHGLLPIYQR